MLMKEIAIMKKMQHPNILNLYEVIENNDDCTLILVTDYMELGHIGSQAHIRYFEGMPRTEMSMKLLRRHFRECISGLFYLHNVVQVIHLDIKPENILVDKNGISKFADFGVSR